MAKSTLVECKYSGRETYWTTFLTLFGTKYVTRDSIKETKHQRYPKLFFPRELESVRNLVLISVCFMSIVSYIYPSFLLHSKFFALFFFCSRKERKEKKIMMSNCWTVTKNNWEWEKLNKRKEEQKKKGTQKIIERGKQLNKVKRKMLKI